MKALLLSGGIDSSALAHWTRPDICVTLDYGQQAALGEAAASRAICSELHLEHKLISVDLSSLGSGSMAGRETALGGAAPEFWPYRNQMLVTLAAMLLQPIGLRELMIGTVATDLHADGSVRFIQTLNALMRLQEGCVTVTAPAQNLTSTELLKLSSFPRELIGVTFSCHLHRYACGQCSGCIKHREVVDEAFPQGTS
ncbi:ExsB family protein [Parvibaculum lavamentivorans DS-1]|uniref:7-cyano-7-deazaguanine synthase n=2 Tax=Parvibaculum lavamentivorans TaxID=256618 RepID=A7HPX5_PARL1|nr:ExsB family protein [Parvibaculum lavamentivorans DS-1]